MHVVDRGDDSEFTDPDNFTFTLRTLPLSLALVVIGTMADTVQQSE